MRVSPCGGYHLDQPNRFCDTASPGTESHAEAEILRIEPDATVKVRVQAAEPDSVKEGEEDKSSATVKVEVQTKPKNSWEEPAAKILPAPDKQIAPVETEAIDEAGKVLGRRIEDLGRLGADVLGQWVNTKAFNGITWLKLILCLLMLLSVFLIDRLFRLLLDWRRLRISSLAHGKAWRTALVDALSGPARIFIYVYGSYAALSPLFAHLRAPSMQSTLHNVAERFADIGGGIAVVWFAYGLVNLVDVRVERGAEALDGKVDDLAASILGKTLRFVVVVIGGILILQNLSGVELGPVIASLGIGGLAIALAAKERFEHIWNVYRTL